MATNKKYLIPFILVTSLFFLWGFAHNLDPILIPHLKKSFTLTTTQDGGAATVLDMPLDKNKILKEIKLQTIANDVMIGLMSVTLVR
jgi:hypothetical protein